MEVSLNSKIRIIQNNSGRFIFVYVVKRKESSFPVAVLGVLLTLYDTCKLLIAKFLQITKNEQ